MTYARLDGLNLSYEDLGRREAPPLVLLHGFTAAEVWEAYVAILQGSSVLVTWERRRPTSTQVRDDGWS